MNYIGVLREGYIHDLTKFVFEIQIIEKQLSKEVHCSYSQPCVIKERVYLETNLQDCLLSYRNLCEWDWRTSPPGSFDSGWCDYAIGAGTWWDCSWSWWEYPYLAFVIGGSKLLVTIVWYYCYQV